MTLNIIHDDRMMERLEPLQKEMSEQSIRYKLWDIVEDTDSVVRSINLSHKRIVSWAKNEGLKEVAIAEDDLHFTGKGGWGHYIKNKPKQFDMYLWGSYIVPLSNNCICGFQLYIINENFYDKFLSVPSDKHIDTEMDNLKGNYKFCYPFSALQRTCWSANNRAVTNYNTSLRPEDIWKG